MKVIIIGGGLFGQLIARGLQEEGHEFTILDSKRPDAGSPPAACLIREEWCGKLGDGVYDSATKWLEQRFTTHKKEFTQFPNRTLAVPGKRFTALWYKPSQLMPYPVREFKVDLVTHRGTHPGLMVGGTDSSGMYEHIHADLVVVAAGAWSQQLVPWVDLGLTGKAGIAYLYPGVKQPGFLVPWAPYKQIVGFDREDGYWVSDGSAIKPENFDDKRRHQSFQRCALTPEESGGHALAFKELYGIRPYTKKLPCFCEEVAPKLWVATGARKNGTLLGAWCAKRIQEEV